MKIYELQERHQKRLSEIFRKHGVFFAFDQKQFKEQREEGLEYVSGPAGMIIPKQKSKYFHKDLDKHVERCRKDFKRYIPLDRYIAYQLDNHEATYTYEIEDAYEAVKAIYPDCIEKDIWRVLHPLQNKEE